MCLYCTQCVHHGLLVLFIITNDEMPELSEHVWSLVISHFTQMTHRKCEIKLRFTMSTIGSVCQLLRRITKNVLTTNHDYFLRIQDPNDAHARLAAFPGVRYMVLDNGTHRGLVWSDDVRAALRESSITCLRLLHCQQGQVMAWIPSLLKLTALHITDMHFYYDPSPLSALSSLVNLTILDVDARGCCLASDFRRIPLRDVVVSLPLTLQTLKLRGILNDVPRSLEPLTNLSKLTLDECVYMTDCSQLSALTQLRKLSVVNCRRMRNLHPVSSLTRLRALNLKCTELDDVDVGPLSTLVDLHSLCVGGWKHILTDLRPLSSLVSLRKLDMSYTRFGERLPDLQCLTGLSEVDISECKYLENIRALTALVGLNTLNVDHCKRLTWRSLDMRVFSNLTSLVDIDGNLTALPIAGQRYPLSKRNAKFRNYSK